MTYKDADVKRDVYSNIAIRFARLYMNTGYDYHKDLFHKYDDLASRYKWAGNMVICRSCYSREELQELRKKLPSFYRVRPQ